MNILMGRSCDKNNEVLRAKGRYKLCGNYEVVTESVTFIKIEDRLRKGAFIWLFVHYGKTVKIKGSRHSCRNLIV
ncbi:hypothetical protein DW836_00370 [Ruminococcus sp. AM34-9LB]|nr:hypothetical protein DW836_00370 [Ruminococcus sp. AM34-9LB]